MHYRTNTLTKGGVMPVPICDCEEPLFDKNGRCYECGGITESEAERQEQAGACRD